MLLNFLGGGEELEGEDDSTASSGSGGDDGVGVVKAGDIGVSKVVGTRCKVAGLDHEGEGT